MNKSGIFLGETYKMSLYEDVECHSGCEVTIGLDRNDRERIIVEIAHTNPYTDRRTRVHWSAPHKKWFEAIHNALAQQPVWYNGSPVGSLSLTKDAEEYWRLTFSTPQASQQEDATCVWALFDAEDIVKFRDILEALNDRSS